jgi:ligand-binding SRPBCC domain-containing protein
MRIKKLKQEQLLPISLEQAWDFFATPKNLNQVTPADMIFEITSEVPEKMYEGLLITYKIRPLLNIPLNWCTEITHIKPMEYFIDEQRFGPYKLWHHEHHFKAVDGGVLMTDLLYYDIGFSIFGRLAGLIFVDERVKDIFNYRLKILESYFQKNL